MMATVGLFAREPMEEPNTSGVHAFDVWMGLVSCCEYGTCLLCMEGL